MPNLEEQISWVVPEYEKHDKSLWWYVIASFVGLLLIIYSFLTANYLFAVIVVLGGIVLLLFDGEEPIKVNVSLDPEGISVGNKFYDYDRIKHFAVIYKPEEKVKNLYFEFKNPFKQRLSISLEDQDPLQIRDFLLQYLEEDIDRTDEPLSEFLAKIFRI